MTSPLGEPLVTIATYNEMENLPRLVEEVFRYLPGADILVIDDNSPDGTGRWCDQQQAGRPRLFCLHRPGKLGLGTAYLDAFRQGMAEGYDQFFEMDADLSHDPRYLPDFFRALAAGARSYKHVDSILKHGLDRLPLDAPTPVPTPRSHENIRGAAYYQASLPEDAPC